MTRLAMARQAASMPSVLNGLHPQVPQRDCYWCWAAGVHSPDGAPAVVASLLLDGYPARAARLPKRKP